MEKEIINKARETAESMLKESNKLIENTIRQIRESQAEREKTRAARQELEEFKDRMIAGKVDTEITSDGKLIRLKKKTARAGIKRKNVVEKDSVTIKLLAPGDAVRMTDTQVAGEVIRVEGDMVHVETGSIKFLVHNDKLERISRADLKKSIGSQMLSIRKDPELESRKLNFKPEIDIRGVRGDEAIRQVRDFIDNAVMVQHRNLRILHGKGNGILRQLVREYLSTIDIVRSFSDEHIELGGSGVTVVEMDL
jgi:DNA mismatch repair protein MutS2